MISERVDINNLSIVDKDTEVEQQHSVSHHSAQMSCSGRNV